MQAGRGISSISMGCPRFSMRKREVRWTVSSLAEEEWGLIHVKLLLGVSDDSGNRQRACGLEKHIRNSWLGNGRCSRVVGNGLGCGRNASARDIHVHLDGGDDWPGRQFLVGCSSSANLERSRLGAREANDRETH